MRYALFTWMYLSKRVENSVLRYKKIRHKLGKKYKETRKKGYISAN